MKRIVSAVLACLMCASVAVAASGCGCQKKTTAKNTNSAAGQPGYKNEPTDPDFMEGDFGYYRLNDNEVKITKYNGKSKNVEIPSEVSGAKVRVIEANLFQNSDLETVKIPNTVTEIQRRAFAGCQNLTEVTIPEGVQVIGENAFWNCKKLEKVTLPASLKKVEWYAFSATALKSVAIPESKTFTTLPDKMFFECADLTEVTLPLTVTTIADTTFEKCSEELNIKAYKGSFGASFAKNHNIKLTELPRS